MQETTLQGPVFGEIPPAVILLFPATVSELPDQQRGKHLRIRRIDPQPLAGGGLGLELATAVMLLGDPFFGADHTDGLGENPG